MPFKNRRETSGENLAHFLTREGGDRFMHRRARPILRQSRAKWQGRKAKKQ
jgi:hypothetical protein